MDELDERFLVISGDVLTDIDLGAHRRRPRRARGAGHHRAGRTSRTRSSSASSSPARTARIERFLEKPTWGQVFSDTINTGIFVLEPEIFDYIAPDRPVDFSERGVPARCSTTGQPLFGAVAEGYWEDVGTLEAYVRAHKDILDGQVAGRHPRLRAAPTACGWARAPRSTPRPRIDGPARDRRQLPRRGRRQRRPVHRARRQRAGAQRRPARAHGRARQRLPRRGVAPAGHGRRPGLRPPQRRARRGGRRARRRVLRRRGRRARRRREGLPVQDGRGRAPSSTRRSCGSRGAPAALFGRDGVAGLANVDITPELATKVAMAYGTTLKKGSTVITSPRLEPLGPHAQAGDDGRAQRRGRQRRRPRGRLGAGHPLPRAPTADAAAASPSGSSHGDPQSVDDPLLRRPTASTSPRTPSARSSGCSTARTSAGCSPARSATSASRPGRSSTTPPRWRPRRHRRRSATAEFKVVLDYAYGSTSLRHAQRAGQARRRRARRQPVRLDRRRASSVDLRQPRGQRGRPRAARREPTSARCIDPDGERAHPHRRRAATCSPTPRRCSPCSPSCRGQLAGDRVALPVIGAAGGRRPGRRRHGVKVRRGPSWRTPALMDAATEPGVGFAGTPTAGSSCPGSCPPSTPRPRS